MVEVKFYHYEGFLVLMSVNLPGGRELHDKFDFKRNNIRLDFIDPLDADIIPSQANNKRE